MAHRFLRDMHICGDDIDIEHEEVLRERIKEEFIHKSTIKRCRDSVIGHDVIERDLNEGHKRLCRDFLMNVQSMDLATSVRGLE